MTVKKYQPDTYTEKGATRIAAIIRTFWRDRGFGGIVSVWLIPLNRHTSDGDMFGVASNLVNGLPPRGR